MLRKHLFALALLGCCCLPLFSQISHKAVKLRLVGDYYVQDTFEILYANRFERNDKNWIDCIIQEDGYLRRRKFIEEKLTFLSEPTGFWEKQYFWNKRLPEKLVSGRVIEYIDQKQHFSGIENDPLLPVFEDMILEDYLEKKLSEVFTKEDEVRFNLRPYIKIVKQEKCMNMAMRSGMMLFSTGLLAQVYSEDELYALLASELTHLLFRHLSESTYEEANLRVQNRYSRPELVLADRIAMEWLTSKGKNPEAWGFLLNRLRRNQFFMKDELNPTVTFPSINFAHYYPHLTARLNTMHYDYLKDLDAGAPDPVMDIRMVELIEYHAYRMKDLKQYDRSLSLINRLIRLEITEASHYMTKVFLLQKLYPDGEKDEFILSQLKMASELNTFIDKRIYEEELRLLIRLERPEEAIRMLNKLDDRINKSSTSNRTPGITAWSRDMRKRLTRALREKELTHQKDVQGKG